MNHITRVGSAFQTRANAHRAPNVPPDSVRQAMNNLWSSQARHLSDVCLAFLQTLVKLNLVGQEGLNGFIQFHADRLAELNTTEKIGRALVATGLLTRYQLERVLAGSTHGLVFGGYRVLDRLGGGSVGVVFLAEHVLLKRKVAIKVLPTEEGFPQSVLDRFYSEMKVLAQLDHPHIVEAYDAGSVPPSDRGNQTLHYLVMELLEGDLENYLYDHGVPSITQGCEWIRQAASGLQQAHDHHLIHRDLKPSNLLRNERNQVKIVDFGLAREFHSNRTEPHCLLGSIEFMAPEQSIDPSKVRGPADIYGLGATLFWLITGQTPYPRDENVAEALRRLQQEEPRRLREFLPDAPQQLDDLINRMLQRNPDARPDSPRAVMRALMRFVTPGAASWDVEVLGEQGANEAQPVECTPHVLILDDDSKNAQLLRAVIEPMGCECHDERDGFAAMDLINSEPIDLLLLDLNLQGLDGYDVCQALREHPPRPHLKILIMSDQAEPDERAHALENGADDFIPKPIALPQLMAQVQHNLRLKSAQDRVDQLARHLMEANKQLEHSLASRETDVRRAEDALLFAMARMAELREGASAGHARRLQKYAVCLAQRLATEPTWAGMADRRFIENVERCIPLLDIGKIGLADGLVQANGKLDDKDRRSLESHPVIGAGLVDAIGKEYGQSLEFLNTARAIVRHHHERFDGTGYPDRLTGEAIPAAARLASLVDAYDSMRSPGADRKSMSHAEAAAAIMSESKGQFDPLIVRAFDSCQGDFQRIYDTIGA